MNTRFSFHSASKTYNGLDDVQQDIVQNFIDYLTLRGLLLPDMYLTDVVRESPLDNEEFGDVYVGKWKEKQVAMKMIRLVKSPVFMIPSDTIRYLTLNNLQEHIGWPYKVNAKPRGMPNLLIRLGSLTSLNNFGGQGLLPRAASREKDFDPQLCVAPFGCYNAAGPGPTYPRLRLGFAPG